MKKRFEVIMAVVLLVGAYFFAREGAHMVENRKALKGEICIVIDAGHGGDDPGKIGINKEKEKDINLKIAKKLKKTAAAFGTGRLENCHDAGGWERALPAVLQ